MESKSPRIYLPEVSCIWEAWGAPFVSVLQVCLCETVDLKNKVEQMTRFPFCLVGESLVRTQTTNTYSLVLISVTSGKSNLNF